MSCQPNRLSCQPQKKHCFKMKFPTKQEFQILCLFCVSKLNNSFRFVNFYQKLLSQTTGVYPLRSFLWKLPLLRHCLGTACSNQYLIDHSSILNRKEHEYWRILKRISFHQNDGFK